jgi:hypothetical protein
VTFALTNTELSTESMSADVPTYQSTDVGTEFAFGLAVTVDDNSGSPVAYVPVAFVAPTTGASGTFEGGSTSVVVVTNVDGIAIAPDFYANETPGGYVVEASLASSASPVTFAMANQAVTTMTVSSVTPTVLSQSGAQSVTVSGSGFESGAAVSFSNPGIRVISTTFVNSETLSANISITSTASVGASNVTVANPVGSSATGENVFTVAPLVSLAPSALALGFARNATVLSRGEEAVIRQFASDLSGSELVECVGYGRTTSLADQRTLLVARYLRSVDSHARIIQHAVVTVATSKVELHVS